MASIKKNIREYVSFSLLVLVYTVSSLRYFPGRWLDTLWATAVHIMSIGPYTIGGTLIVASILHKIAKEKLPWKNILRIFLAVSILIELFIGISHYYNPQ